MQVTPCCTVLRRTRRAGRNVPRQLKFRRSKTCLCKFRRCINLSHVCPNLPQTVAGIPTFDTVWPPSSSRKPEIDHPKWFRSWEFHTSRKPKGFLEWDPRRGSFPEPHDSPSTRFKTGAQNPRDRGTFTKGFFWYAKSVSEFPIIFPELWHAYFLRRIEESGQRYWTKPKQGASGDP